MERSGRLVQAGFSDQFGKSIHLETTKDEAISVSSSSRGPHGLVLPDRPNLSLELQNEFWSKDLEGRRMLCPDLFLAGSTAINDDAQFHLISE
jgi:hypothetical protein